MKLDGHKIPRRHGSGQFFFPKIYIIDDTQEGKLRWFKHFTDNHRGRTVQRLLDEAGHSGALAYYFIMELCAEKLQKIGDRGLDETDCVFIFNRKVIENVTRMKWKSIQFVMVCGSECGVWEWEAIGNEIKIKMPILLDLLDRDLKGTRSRRAQDAKKPRPELDIELESDKELEKNNILCSELKNSAPSLQLENELNFFQRISVIKPELESAWLKAYPKDWISDELKKAEAWVIANPRRAPKNASKFLTNWFSNGWERHRKTIPTEKQNGRKDFNVHEAMKIITGGKS